VIASALREKQKCCFHEKAEARAPRNGALAPLPIDETSRTLVT
jgi:hypothetical protein